MPWTNTHCLDSIDEESLTLTRDWLRQHSKPSWLAQYYKELCRELEELESATLTEEEKEELGWYNDYDECVVQIRVFNCLFQRVLDELFPSFEAYFEIERTQYFSRRYILITVTNERESVDVVSV